MEQVTRPLTNLQLELLKLFAYSIPDEELKEVRNVLTDFFANRVRKQAAKVWVEKGYTQNDMDEWLNDENQ